MAFCVHCGQAIAVGANFCGHCGKRLSAGLDSEPAVVAAATAPPAVARTPSAAPAERSAAEELARKIRSPDWPQWVAVFVIATVVGINFAVAHFEGYTAPLTALAGAIGASIPPIGIGGLIGYLVGRRGRQPVAGFVSGTIIVFVLELVGSYDHLRQLREDKQQTSQAVAGIRDDVHRVFSEHASSSNTGAIPPPAPGEMGELQKFIRSVTEQFTTIHADYLKELHAIGWSTVLNAQRIRDDVGLRDSHRIVTQAMHIVAKFDLRSQSTLKGLEQQIQTLPISQALRDEALSGFRKGLAANNHMAEEWKLEGQIVEQVGSIFSLLTNSKGWEVKGDKILFARQDELERFNASLAAIHSLRDRETQIRNDAQTQTTERLDSLQREVAQ